MFPLWFILTLTLIDFVESVPVESEGWGRGIDEIASDSIVVSVCAFVERAGAVTLPVARHSTVCLAYLPIGFRYAVYTTQRPSRHHILTQDDNKREFEVEPHLCPTKMWKQNQCNHPTDS